MSGGSWRSLLKTLRRFGFRRHAVNECGVGLLCAGSHQAFHVTRGGDLIGEITPITVCNTQGRTNLSFDTFKNLICNFGHLASFISSTYWSCWMETRRKTFCLACVDSGIEALEEESSRRSHQCLSSCPSHAWIYWPKHWPLQWLGLLI